MRSGLLAFAALLLGVTPVRPAAPTPSRVGASKVFLTVEEALELAFPGCEVERRTIYLKPELQKRVAGLAKKEFQSGVVFPYVATREGRLVGTAYFDTHRVRSLRETMMFVVSPKGELGRVELLAFAEPLEYVPRERWYEQFVGRALDDELELARGIRPVTGASLTARATTDAARRALALHQVLEELRAEEEAKREGKRVRREGGECCAGEATAFPHKSSPAPAVRPPA